MASSFRFRVYVTGSPRWERTERQLRRLCEQRLGSDFEIEMVDVMQQPDLADAERIVATPTVDRIEPPPRIRIVGDISVSDRVATVLGLPIISNAGDVDTP